MKPINFISRALVSGWLLSLVRASNADYTNPHCKDGKQVIVQLFEWHWDWVAEECEKVLGPKGFCGVQVSPPQEHIQGNSWWTRYQPVSYILQSRSGSREQFKSMVSRCKAAGVIVIVNSVLNHMTGHGMSGTGTAGSSFDGNSERYDAVPYSSLDFHQPYCDINNYNNAEEVRNCYLVSLNDLDGSKQYVREKVSNYLNDLIGLGVVGFRVDASKHMWPGDLKAIQDMTRNLEDGSRPFFVHEVIDLGGEAIKAQEYTHIGKVTEFRYGQKLAQCIRSNDFNCLAGIYDPGWGMVDGMHALVFVDNHDNQRSQSVITAANQNNQNDWQYKVASAFMLGYEYGFKRIMSSYYFNNNDQGPPSSPPTSFPSWSASGNGWTCEHRWSPIMNMVKFANVAAGLPITHWQASGTSLGFGRGNVAFLALGNLDRDFETGLPDGDYCDLIRGCPALSIRIEGGRGHFPSPDNDPVVAICVGC